MRYKKGTTLAELCVAIALLAIVVTMTLTFSQLNREHLRQAEQHDALLTDLTNFERIMRQWIRNYDNMDYVVKAERSAEDVVGENDVLAMYRKGNNSSPVSKLRFENDTLLCDGLNDYTSTAITGMTFSVHESDEGRRLIECDVSYINHAEDEEGTMHYIYTVHSQGTYDGKGAVIMRPLGGLFKPE